MSFWSFFSRLRKPGASNTPPIKAGPSPDQNDPTPPPGVYCRAAYITGHREECRFCEALLKEVSAGRKTIVILAAGSDIYAQGNFPLLSDDDVDESFKAIWPLWWYLQDQFFTLMVEVRGAERFFFVDEPLKDKFSKIPQFIDIKDLFVLVKINSGKS